eukprot:7086427-Pyramimonas_sp.AAC.1
MHLRSAGGTVSVPMMVRFGQYAYSAFITMGFEETATLLSFFNKDSVRSLIWSAIAGRMKHTLCQGAESAAPHACPWG